MTKIGVINVYDENININNINGSFFIDDDYSFFYKINSYKDYKREIDGYNIIKNYYDVPKLIYSESKNNSGLLLFEYVKSVGNNSGLLVDYFAENEKITEKYISILKKYRHVFQETLSYMYTKDHDVLFKNRINDRLDKYLNENFYDHLNNIKNIQFKGQKIELCTVKNIIDNVRSFFYMNQKTYTVISQCDPNDLNICENGIILDYLGGGHIPITAEMATFIWYYIAQGEYLALKYNKKAFEKHTNIYNMMGKVVFNDNNLLFDIRKIRIEAINDYLDLVIAPIISNLNFKNWYAEFKNYIAMKILSVFNLTDMTEEDMILSLSYLILFYNKNNIKDINEFKEFLNNIL